MFNKQEIDNLEALLLSGNEDSIKVGLAIVAGMEEVPDRISNLLNKAYSFHEKILFILAYTTNTTNKLIIYENMPIKDILILMHNLKDLAK